MWAALIGRCARGGSLWRARASLLSSKAGEAASTPAMAQYFRLKEEHPGYLLLFRLGDFYEMFYEDAVAASTHLGIALTARKSSKKAGAAPVPMAGIPHFAADSYIEKLVRKGIRVAVCDQVEDVAAAKRRRASVVARQVTRLITPGTLVDDRFLKPQENNFLCSLVLRTASDDSLPGFDLAWTDLSTGDFQYAACPHHHLNAELLRLAPKEILVSRALLDAVPDLLDFIRQNGWHLTLRDGSSAADAADAPLSPACRVLLDYVRETQKSDVLSTAATSLQTPLPYQKDATMYIDPCAWQSLELTRRLRVSPSSSSSTVSLSSSGSESKTGAEEANGSLFELLDQTVTPAGSRLLASRLGSPLVCRSAIEERLDLVDFFFKHPALADKLRELLAQTFDLARCLQRLSLGRGSPRDLLGVVRSLELAAHVKHALLRFVELLPGDATLPPAGFVADLHAMEDLTALAQRVGAALSDSAGSVAALGQGGYIAAGYNARLDGLRELSTDTQKVVLDMQQRFRDATGVKSLRVKHNNIVGYFVELSSSALAGSAALPAAWTFLQQLTNGFVRYKPRELAELELAIQRADNEAAALEAELFDALRADVLARSAAVRFTSHLLATVDVAIAMSALAHDRLYVRPRLLDDDRHCFDVSCGRHPIVEAVQDGSAFAANDCRLAADQHSVALITGPNMGGKSTYLRQNAIIAIMAQMGSFVPARSATVGLVDSIFSRVGSSDDLANNLSTFMVEMIETANILARAGPRSFVIMDEVGRGTSTQDGLSIAWAVLEHLHNVNRSRVLFATHYRELARLANSLPRLACMTMEVLESPADGDGILFTHRIVPGIADRSYGIHCAQLAGLPSPVIARAQEILDSLEK